MTALPHRWHEAQLAKPAKRRISAFVARLLFFCAKRRWFGFTGAMKTGEKLYIFTAGETIVMGKL